MVGLNVLQLLLFLLVGGGSIYYLTDFWLKKRAQIDCENAFFDRYEEIINRQRNIRNREVIPLTFEHQDAQNLRNLCAQGRSKWSLMNYVDRIVPHTDPPSIQIGYLYFRTLGLAPITPSCVEIIRCSENYALLEAGDGHSAYILKKYVGHLYKKQTTFYIFAEFQYKQSTP